MVLAPPTSHREPPVSKKSKKNTAQRGAKKHEKAKKREKKLDARRREAARPPISAEDAWRPAREGVVGLARRMRMSVHAAGDLAEHMLEHHGREDVRGCWLPSQLQAMPTEAILAALAERGVQTDQAAYEEQGRALRSSQALARERWLPALPEKHSPHDEDLLFIAAEALWQRWLNELLSDEEIDDVLEVADGAGIHGHGGGDLDLDLLGQLWERLVPEGGLARLRQAGQEDRFLRVLADGLMFSPEDEDTSAWVPWLLAILSQLEDDSPFRHALELELWGRAEDATIRDGILAGHLDAAERDPRSVRIVLAVDLLFAVDDATDAQIDLVEARLRDVEARLTALRDPLAERAHDLVLELQTLRDQLAKGDVDEDEDEDDVIEGEATRV